MELDSEEDLYCLHLNRISVLTGGEQGEVDLYEGIDDIRMYQEDGWTTVAHMKLNRMNHAASVVNIDDFC